MSNISIVHVINQEQSLLYLSVYSVS